ncbi:MAG: ABC transporter ATP-binding protein [Myxococcota bacterium]
MSSDFYEDDSFKPTRLDVALWGRILARTQPYRTELIGMATMGLLIAGVDIAIPLITATLVDGASAHSDVSDLVPYGGLYFVLLSILAAAVYVFIWLAGRIATGMAHDFRRDGFAKFQRLEFAFYDQHAIGWLVARLTSDVGKVSSLLPWLLLDMCWGSATIFGASLAMLWFDPWLAMVVLVVVPPMGLVSLWFQRTLLDSSRKVRRANARITASFNEALGGVRTTKALAREVDNLGEFQELTDDMFQRSLRRSLESAVYLPLVVLLSSIGVGLALWVGGANAGTSVSLGTLIAFMQYAALFSGPIRDLAQKFTELQAAQAAAERIGTLLDAEPAIQSPEEPVVRAPGTPVRRIDFASVDFAYKPEEPVLQDCTFTVRAGQTIALVGPTGGGKSTIVKLLSRFYDVTNGSIAIDHVDLRDWDLKDLQRQFGIVLQDPHLFSGTIADNLRYGRLDATDAEVRDAAALVHADRFIERLPDGYETRVGEGGSRLSTGQRQLVALGRAVLADPQIFILDEATSSVDTETERAIQAGIQAAMQGRIAFVIAHRLSTIRDADGILFVKDGRIAERGTHAELVAKGGLYAGLVDRHRPTAFAASA